MTDIWCFTCGHEIRRTLTGYEHIDQDDVDQKICPCTEDGFECQP